jgi:hypothetical protein
MRLHFVVYSRRPLGRLLGEILEKLETLAASRPRSVTLSSRQGREDLSRDEVLTSAAASSADMCHMQLADGEIMATWKYGAGKAVPQLFGTLEVAPGDIPAFDALLRRLATVTGASYAICDLETVELTLPDGTDPYVGKGVFLDLFWWNYFGPEYQATLQITDRIKSGASRLEIVEGGAIVLVTRDIGASRKASKAKELVAEWPFFLRSNPKAQALASIDYSEIRQLRAAPVPAEVKRSDLIGPPDSFIAEVSQHADRFLRWAAERNAPRPETVEQFRRFIRAHRAVIADELLVATVAAYGEAVRREMGGTWSKAGLFGRGEPVVSRPGRPWTRRRVIDEVFDVLEEDPGHA